MTLPARGHVLLDVGQYFNIETLLSGHSKLSETSLSPSSRFERGTALQLSEVAARLSKVRDQTRPSLVLPVFRNTGSNWTGIAVVNQTSGPAYVALDVVSSEGVAVARVHAAALKLEAQFVFNINEVVGSWTGEGYLRLTSDAPVSGLQITGGGDPGTTSFGGLGRATKVRHTTLCAAHRRKSNHWQSRISLINISPVEGEGVLTVEAIDSQGRQLAVTTLRLASGR